MIAKSPLFVAPTCTTEKALHIRNALCIAVIWMLKHMMYMITNIFIKYMIWYECYMLYIWFFSVWVLWSVLTRNIIYSGPIWFHMTLLWCLYDVYMTAIWWHRRKMGSTGVISALYKCHMYIIWLSYRFIFLVARKKHFGSKKEAYPLV